MRLLLVVGLLLASSAAQAREGTLALVNLSGSTGHDLVLGAADELKDLVGGWARQPSIAGYLAGRPNPGALPAGDVGKDLGLLVDRVRSRQAATADVAALGRLLGVDYLLMMVPRGRGYSAKLFSVQRSTYAPQSIDLPVADAAQLREYVRGQTRPAAPAPAFWRHKKWWILGLVVVVGGVTLGLAIANRDESSGDLRVRVSR